jgi:tetratricopeptide (TPR) repeat protein
MDRFSFLSRDQIVTEEDFLRFSPFFSAILLEKIPTATTVTFHTSFEQIEHLFPEERKGAAAKELFEQKNKKRGAIKIAADSLLLPFTTNHEKMVVARVAGVDPLVIRRAAKDWLAEIQTAAFRDFLYLKQARTDAETGLLNGAHLSCLLDTLVDYELLHLVLVELPPKNRFPRDAFHNARKAAVVLQGFAGGGLVHHLGHCVFAILLANPEKEGFAVRFGSSLVASLKREGFQRVHIGSAKGTGNARTQGESRKLCDRLLAEAWSALQTAAKRGPFSFCDYSVLAHPEKHPLHSHRESLVRKIRRKYLQTQQFCLVELRKEGLAAGQLAEMLGRHIDSTEVFTAEDSALLFLDGDSQDVAHNRVAQLLQALDHDAGLALQISAGIGHFPYADFQKSEILANCRKALLHAAFFGPGAIVAFDAVSLNISGDIFYGDGDLPRAVQEYKRGLVCEAANVNLLNSLGVAYAFLDRHALARESFKKALAVEPGNFMSLYNLGLGEVLRGNIHHSLQCFEQARAVHCEEDGPDVKKDLELQLAKLYCRLGLFDKAYALLTEWYESYDNPQLAGPALRYLGESCFRLGRSGEAKIWLQKALRFNEFDSEALGLLGLVYLEEGEGDEISLTLCEKSVELNPTDTVLRFGLAKVQAHCGLLHQARQNLAKCIGNKKIQAEVQFWMGRVYQGLGKKKQARRWFGKIQHDSEFSPEFAREIQAGMEN